MKLFFSFFGMAIFLAFNVLAFEGSDFRNHTPEVGAYCDVHTTDALFSDQEGWCRLGDVKTAEECQGIADRFGEAENLDVEWTYTRVQDTALPDASFIAERYVVFSTSGNTQDLREEFDLEMSLYEDWDNFDIDQRLYCAQSKQIAHTSY